MSRVTAPGPGVGQRRSSLPGRLGAPLAVVLGAVAVAAAIRWADPATPGGVIPPCASKTFLHVVCPGCGSTRAIQSLVDLDLGAALAYNALAVVLLVMLGVALVQWTRARISGQWRPRWYQLRYAPATMLAVVVVWTVVRNIPVAPLSALRV